MNDTIGTLPRGRYSNKNVVVDVILEVDIHVFVVIYGSFVIKYLNLNHKLSAQILKSI